MTQKGFDKAIGDINKNIFDIAKLLDELDELIENLPDDFKDIKEDKKPVEEKEERVTNKYNIGDVVYIPFRIKGMEARITKIADACFGEKAKYKTEILYKLTRPMTIDGITKSELRKNESGGPYWNCFATEKITQESLEAIQEDLK